MQKRIYRYLLFLLFAALLLTGCQRKYSSRNTSSGEQETDKTEEESPAETEGLFLITGIDTEGKSIVLRNCTTLKEASYAYTGATYIRDKYGGNLTMSQISVGEIVTIEGSQKKLTTIQISDKAFSYGDLHNFTLDVEHKILTVGNDSYYFDGNIVTAYKNSMISLGEISSQDTICLKGLGKQIYAIQVITGHGTIVLQNTEVFEGGYITVGNLLSQQITAEMRIEVAEGTHHITVANNGYGGSTDIIVEANRETAVNLEELKGEGPKFCTIQFHIVPENGTAYLNGEKIDVTQPMQVSYGVYRLSGEAEGYAAWSRILVVSSPEAEITIELGTENDTEETITTAENEEDSGAEAENTNTSSDTGTEDSAEETQTTATVETPVTETPVTETPVTETPVTETPSTEIVIPEIPDAGTGVG